MSRKSSLLLACRSCHMILGSSASFCPNCKSGDLSEDWSGLVIIFDPQLSPVAKMLKIDNPGRYALKVR